MWHELYTNGVIPFSRANITFDALVISMALICPVLLWSIGLVKKGQYVLHAKVQTTLAFVLLIAVIFFEVDIRLNGWRHMAKESPFYDSILFPSLIFHICCSVVAVGSWVYMIVSAKKIFKDKIGPGQFSHKHRRMGHLAKNFMLATAVSGWFFYYLAFIAS